MARMRTYTDDDLVVAVAGSRSWRETMRKIGLVATSSRAIASVRSHADVLGLEYSHFSKQRRLTQEEVRDAVAIAETWADAAAALKLHGPAAVTRVRGHAMRFGVDLSPIAEPDPVFPENTAEPALANLGRAGSLLAASWFTLCGHSVSWPLEPSRFDLLVNIDRSIRRIQVKTTTVRVGDSWKVYLSTAGRTRKTYDPSEIDDFFIIDGALSYYLIPAVDVGGLQAIHLRAYERYRLRNMPR